MEKLYHVEVSILDENGEVKKYNFLRPSLSDAAVQGWQLILEAKGGSMRWVKPEGTHVIIGVFLPIGHPSHTYLITEGKVAANQHYCKLAVKLVNIQERHMETITIDNNPDSLVVFPGTIICGKN